MSVSAIVIATVVVGIVGIVIGIVLGIAGEKFKVEVDPKEEACLDALPGNNCGACGFAGCSGLAAAIAKGEAPVNTCPVGGAPVAEKIAAIMGVEAGESEKEVAFVMCGGTCDKTKDLYNYKGVQDCQTVKFMQNGGPKGCTYGCMGFGSCVKVCQFDAIHVINGVAVVDKEKCTACQKCIKTCPQNIIELVPYKSTHQVNCHSQDKGKDVMQVCDVGCIGCRLCEKACPFDAIHVENNIAHIDQSKCKHCGFCAGVCPRNIILGRKTKKPKPKKPKDAPKKDDAAKAPEKPAPKTAEPAAKAPEKEAKEA